MQRWNLPTGWVISARPAHPAIVSEADYIARQRAGTCWPGYSPAGPADGDWSRPGPTEPAYRCRHGCTSATGSGPGRPADLYVREDQILPRLAALAILHADSSHSPRARKQASAQVTTPAHAADPIDRLRAADVTLTYDPATRALRDCPRNTPAVTVA